MDSVETFASHSNGPGQLSRRRLIKAFAATLAATKVVGLGVGGPDAAVAVPVTTLSPPSYAGILGLL